MRVHLTALRMTGKIHKFAIMLKFASQDQGSEKWGRWIERMIF